LGSTYLGVNSLYSEILSLLSFAELGFGSAINFALYKPVAENNRNQIVKLLDFYKIIYRIVAAVVTMAGLATLPFLGYIVKGADWLTLSELRLYYVIFLINTVVGYFVSYKYSYLNALQKNYIQTSIETIVSLICGTAQIVAILLWKNYLVYLLVNTGLLIVSRFIICCYLNYKFPILIEKPKNKLSDIEKKSIYKDVKGIVVHRFSSVAIHSTDNIIISSLSEAGVVTVGLISNYTMLMNSIGGFVEIIFNSVTSGFGNLVAESTTSNYRNNFKLLNFINYWIYGFCAISFFVLIPPFISLWIGSDKLVNTVVFLLIVINFYMQGQSIIYANARAAKGNFSKDKWWSFAQAIINLVVSIVGVKLCGLVGVYIGTIVSRIFYTIGRPLSTYSFLFEESVVQYYMSYLRNMITIIIAGGITYLITRKLLVVSDINVFKFILACLLDAIVPNVLLLIFNIRNKEFHKFILKIRDQMGEVMGK
jgi:O-antigen/teichoic acid export membrane protein